MIRKLKYALLGAAIAALAVLAPVAIGQMMYGNTFPFWNVSGPLDVGGATTLRGGVVVTGAASATTGYSAPVFTATGFMQFPAPRTITADGAVAATDSWVIANKAGTLTLTLPDPTTAANTGRLLCVKTSQAQTVVSATTNVVPLITGAAAAAILAATAGKWACMVSDATNWVIMAAN